MPIWANRQVNGSWDYNIIWVPNEAKATIQQKLTSKLKVSQKSKTVSFKVKELILTGQ